ncbi:enamine deaminase RidA (YjgF/YER057c/UK114 family) [Microbacterium halimionae]|uniref:Enamine deaminase RidA (YjgF/YER057c/UK114 family) n=1 Tax=Microbacterium halimionae TaxID=1526413 RepID=A0A7W3JMG1_9MICO|nr:RidA family protein [Microbacterium halimionae]MBA8815530.1 enamine deaminase RidA (YjgF/YER057c/UK114 family) [Microbacterium halimionae]NII95577.1 enamine deaminase RidA (YjgF/YER057c/UK114 family) [Microbacterium halimionae]
MSVSASLANLGIDLPDVASPVASYIPATTHGDLVFTSGQLPFVAGILPATGKVGEGRGHVDSSDANQYARVSALNAVAAAAAAVGGVDRLTGVVKVTGFVASAPEFTGQPGVINGASELLGEIFGEAGTHARSAVGVAVLPLDSPVEVEVIFSFE